MEACDCVLDELELFIRLDLFLPLPQGASTPPSRRLHPPLTEKKKMKQGVAQTEV